MTNKPTIRIKKTFEILKFTIAAITVMPHEDIKNLIYNDHMETILNCFKKLLENKDVDYLVKDIDKFKIIMRKYHADDTRSLIFNICVYDQYCKPFKDK